MTVDTIYPFSDSLSTTITATKAFTYYVRIPSWTVNGTISINGGGPSPVSPTNGLQAVKAKAGTTSFTLNLPAEITLGLLLGRSCLLNMSQCFFLEDRPQGSIAVHRGPLHYAFDSTCYWVISYIFLILRSLKFQGHLKS